MARNVKEKFDERRQYAATRPIRCGSRTFNKGDGFEASLVTPRRLRQLYDSSYLQMLPEREEVMPPADDWMVEYVQGDRRPEFWFMTVEELQAYLLDHKIVARPNWERAKLVERCEKALEKEAADREREKLH